MLSSFQVAALQMVSSSLLDDNLDQAEKLIREAAESGCQLVSLPEYFCFMGHKDRDKLAIKESDGSGRIQDFLYKISRKYAIWIIGGTLPIETNDPNRIYNSLLVYGPDGQRITRYDKIHLFSFTKGSESYNEAISIRAGKPEPHVFDAPFGRVGVAVCYDLRFPELFRAMDDIQLLVIPSAFTYTTGQAHWEILLRARAIENQCYVLAPAQGGKHENGRRTWGHSMLITPWGEVQNVLGEGPGCVSGLLDLDYLRKIRENLPALAHRVM